MQKIIFAAAAMSVFCVAARAEDPPAAPAVATNISLTSNYKFRGQDQGNAAAGFKPALQGGFDYANSGFYVGNWNSSIGWVKNGNLEIDLYGGYKGEIIPDLGYDVGVLTYVYPGSGYANTTEIYAAVSYSIATFKYSHTVSSDYFGFIDGRNTGYYDLAVNYPIIEGLTLNAHAGFTQFSGGGKNNGGVNYSDYKLGATYDLGSGFSIAGAAVGGNKQDSYLDVNNGVSINKPRFIVTLTKAM